MNCQKVQLQIYALKLFFNLLIQLEENKPKCNFLKTFHFYMSWFFISIYYFYNMKK